MRIDDPLRGFLLRLPLTLLLSMLVWVVLRPGLDRTVSGLAEALIRAYEVPRVTRLTPDRHWVGVRRADSPPTSSPPALALTGVHFNTVVLLALALALPRPWSRRQLERVTMAWAVLLLTQVLNLVFEVKSLYATRAGAWSLANSTRWARDIFGFLQLFTDLPLRFSAPFVIWYGFNADLVAGLLAGGVGREPRALRGGGRKRDRGEERSPRPTSTGGGTGSRGGRTPSSSRSGRRGRG